MHLQKHWMYLLGPILFTILTYDLGGIWLIHRLMHYFMDKITISEQNFNIKSDIILITSKSMPLNRISKVEYSQNFLGKLFGYGTLSIESKSNFGLFRHAYISNPETIKNILEQKSQKTSIVIPKRLCT